MLHTSSILTAKLCLLQDYRGSWRLHRVTLSNCTVVDFDASFCTEPQQALKMHAAVRELCCTWLAGFKAIRRPYVPSPQQRVPSPPQARP